MSKYSEWHAYVDSCIKEECSDDAIFLRFFVLWNAYNYLYNQLYPKKDYDCNKAVYLAKNENLKLYYDNKVKHEALMEFKKIPSFKGQEQTRTKVVDSRHNQLCHFQNAEFNDHKCTLKDLLYAIYKIRCNLFHGYKTPYNTTDKRLVSWAFKYLNQILKNYDENWLN